VAKATLEERFWSKVRKTETCWLWTGGKTTAGYGHIWDGSKVVYAHRLAYEWFVSPIPESLTIDHLCRVPACVNPSHLEPVTIGENTRRGTGAERTRERHAAQTHCKRGHLFDEANTLIGTKGERRCRACLRFLAKQSRGPVLERELRCPICGTAFTSTHSRAQFCSGNCRARAYRRRKRDKVTL
jgi:hypothetical protein